jgi:hypothetical protein
MFLPFSARLSVSAIWIICMSVLRVGEATSDKLDELFRELRELSSGPLRTQNYGFCSIGGLPQFVNQILGANEQLKIDG